MRAAARCALMLLLIACSAGGQTAQTRGLKPRAKISEYPVFVEHGVVAMGAELLSNSHVQHAFATELDKRYLVIEIGAFPANQKSLKLSADNFALRVAGTKQLIRPAAPKTIADALHKDPPTSRDVVVYPTTEVGYETGGRDIYGNPRGGGWSTRVGTGVAIGKTQKGATDADRRVTETELKDKSLPEGEVTQPVAGYLYFPLTTKRKATYELEYSTDGQTITLLLPTAAE